MSAIVPRLELRQGQSLVMTQQLQQSIKILQLSSQELVEYIEQEVEKNPLLSMEEENDSAAPEKQEQGEGQEPSESASESAENEGDTATATDERQDDWQEGDETYDSEDFSAEPRGHTRINDEYEDAGNLTANKVTLRDHLLNQFLISVTDPAMRMVGQHLIDLVDESGYIKDDTDYLKAKLGCDDALLEATFGVLHTLDPVGVCARSLKECLALQLRDKNRFDPAMQAMLEHLDLMATGKMAELSRICGVDAEDIKDMCAEIRALNPRPGSQFLQEDSVDIIPDVTLRRIPGKWLVELNPAALPKVLVNRKYQSQLTGRSLGKDEKKYITDQLATANWLVKALDQRAQTILKVATETVAQQDNFFQHGIKYLRPLTLRDIAAATGLHESTVSRVTNNKFMATPRGTFELKYFFNASLQNAAGGEAFSNKAVQYIIKELITNEQPEKPFSDEYIAEKLKEKGIEVARRTVAKYREIMNIPSSSTRKKLAQASH